MVPACIILNQFSCSARCVMEGMMVNFICHLDWAMGCPNIWSDILGVSVSVLG